VAVRGQLAAAIYTLIQTARLNDVDPQAWLADALARLQDHPAKRIDELKPRMNVFVSYFLQWLSSSPRTCALRELAATMLLEKKRIV
jgi:IS66 C-terminal element